MGLCGFCINNMRKRGQLHLKGRQYITICSITQKNVQFSPPINASSILQQLLYSQGSSHMRVNLQHHMKSKVESKQREEILNKIPIFLAKTFRIIDNPEYFDIVSWTDDGQSFVVKDVSRLTDEVFLCHFKHTNFASFVRQLNMYGFRKIRSDEEEGPVFHHEYFQKKNLELLLQMRRKNVGTVEENVEGAVVAVSGREERLQREVEMLKSQHEQLQNMMQIVMEQNKTITAQNKAFAGLMGQMKEKYRKKLQTLMLLFLFGKKAKAEDGDFLFPPQLEHMLSAFEQMNSAANPLIIFPQQKRKRNQQLRMITGEPHSYSDVERSDNGSQLDHGDKDDIFRVLKEFKEEESMGNAENGREEMKIEGEGEREFEPLPPSPLSSVVSRAARVQRKKCEWDDFLQGMNHSDHSDFQLPMKDH